MSLPSRSFAGFWRWHLKRSERRAFFDKLHRALAPGAVVMLLDNLYVEGASTPIAHTDAEGNTYQQRAGRPIEACGVEKFSNRK